MKKSVSICILLLLTVAHIAAQTHVDVTPAVWMPKAYLDARQKYSPKDPFWKTIDFSKLLSPVASLRIQQEQVSMQTYGTDNFPVTIKDSLTSPGRKEWILDKPIFNGGQAAAYDNVTFSLISHNKDPHDLWLGLTFPDGKKDSTRFAQVPKESASTPLWLHANNYLSYLFKGNSFDIYDNQSHLLYSNVQTTSDGKVSGLPGITEWNILSGNTLQLTENKKGEISFASFTISFDGDNVTLQPQQATGVLNQQLLLKEKQK